MFEGAIIDLRRGTPPYALALSLLGQVAALGVLLTLPLLYTQSLPGIALRSVLAAPAPPPPPTPRARALVKAQAKSNARVFSVPASVISRVVVARQPEALAAPPQIGSSSWPGGVYEGAGVMPNSVAPPPPAPGKTPPRPAMRISAGVSGANLIHRVQPLYPPLARATRVQGTVEFTATISKEGLIENLELVRGHPLLVKAARDAILQWRYRPTLLNGEPMEVVTGIIVNFRLAQ